MNTPRVHPAYSLEIVVSEDQIRESARFWQMAPATSTSAWLAHHTNPRGIQGGLGEALNKADAVVGVSAPGVLSRGLIKKMSRRPIVFALANPHPEVDPDDIADLGAVIATGSSDYPNQVNNALAFPGLFQGVLGSSTAQLDEQVFLAAAHALVNLAKPASATRLLPEVRGCPGSRGT